MLGGDQAYTKSSNRKGIMENEPTQENLKNFDIRLFQKAWHNTEVFPVQAVDEEDAKAQAKEWLEGKRADFPEGEEYRVEIQEIVPPVPAEEPRQEEQ